MESINDLFLLRALTHFAIRSMEHHKDIKPRICQKLLRAKRKSQPVVEEDVSKKWKLFCKILTFGFHWFKHYPGERRYVRCRFCEKLPKSQWKQLQKIRK